MWSPSSTIFWSRTPRALRDILQSKMHALLDLAALAGMIKAATRLYTAHSVKNHKKCSKIRKVGSI